MTNRVKTTYEVWEDELAGRVFVWWKPSTWKYLF